MHIADQPDLAAPQGASRQVKLKRVVAAALEVHPLGHHRLVADQHHKTTRVESAGGQINSDQSQIQLLVAADGCLTIEEWRHSAAVGIAKRGAIEAEHLQGGIVAQPFRQSETKGSISTNGAVRSFQIQTAQKGWWSQLDGWLIAALRIWIAGLRQQPQPQAEACIGKQVVDEADKILCIQHLRAEALHLAGHHLQPCRQAAVRRFGFIGKPGRECWELVQPFRKGADQTDEPIHKCQPGTGTVAE